MKNITKTTKTLLFASLIAALILPFSGMMMAEAAPNEKTFDKVKVKSMLKEKLDKLKQDKTETNDEKKQAKLDRQIKRVDIFSQLADLKESIDNETNSKKIEKLETKAQKLIEKYNNSIQPDEIEMAQSTTSSPSSGDWLYKDISFETKQYRNADCENPNRTIGLIKATGKSYPDKIVLDYTTFYPYKIGETASDFGCDKFNGQYIHSKLNTVEETCWHYMYPVTGTYSDMTCNSMEMGDVILVTNQAWYNGGKMFAGEGWTIMLA